MPKFDKQKFANHLDDNALPAFGKHKCAAYVHRAIVAGGLLPIGNPIDAKDWGPTLARLGFTVISNDNYTPMQGDIAVIQGTSASTAGHIEGYDGKHWVSDFVQSDFWPGPTYRDEQPSYVVYRWNL